MSELDARFVKDASTEYAQGRVCTRTTAGGPCLVTVGDDGLCPIHGNSVDTYVETLFTQDMTNQHRTRVSIHNGMYVIVCDICDRVGQPQDFEIDAENIAARHQEIGGFER